MAHASITSPAGAERTTWSAWWSADFRKRSAVPLGGELHFSTRTEDLSGLRNLANALGERFIAGYVLYTGQQTLPFGDKIRAVPLDALWRLAP